jgi:DNA-binding GntR family transcriptional regulator
MMSEKPAGVSRINPAKRLSPAVYQEIKSRIVSGEYAAGEWLSVEELCGVFQVSRQPIMEAMRRLAGDWLVEVIPQVGCRVANYDRRALVDFINTFGEMEAHVAELAAKRRTPEQLAHLTNLAAQIRQRDTMDAENFRLGREFHLVVLEMAHSAVLARLCEQMWDIGTFASIVLTQAQIDREAVRRRSETLDQLTEAIRLKNQGLARLHMELWLTALTVALVADEQPGPPSQP